MIRFRQPGYWRRVGPQYFGFALALWVLSSEHAFAGEIIHLKNGKTISAEVVRQDQKQIFLQRGEAEIAIPLALVDRVEKTSPAASSDPTAKGPSGPAARRIVPLPQSPGDGQSLDPTSPVIKDGALDEAYLSRLDNDFIHASSPENRRALRRGYQQAAVFLTQQGDPEGSIEKYRHALKLLGEDGTLTLALGYLMVKQNHFTEAVDLLLPATDRYPGSADLHLLLGSAFYGMDNLDQAITEWKKVLAIHDDPKVREATEKAERERNVAGSYMELRSEHFLLRYEGRETEALSEQVLRTLEAVFHELQLDLDLTPSETIVVLLYPSQAFRDITRTPDWVGAMNDGKIRVPISGLTEMTADLARVLKHELVHSFVRQITLGRCPTWFNEGLAQLEEGATTAGRGSQLARAYAEAKSFPLSSLERPFVELSPDQVLLAYAESLAALEYLHETFGMNEIRRLLKAIPSQPDINSLLQDELRLTYPAFEQEVALYIVKRYGA